jgi:ABC transport system ATP-binding/permease protein
VIDGNARHVIGYLADFLFPRERAVSPVRTLSGGERNRLLLARLFAKPANVLVLDEPTNDLDIETLELLEELIAAFDGTVLLVSHDRAFLDNIVTSTLAFEGDGRAVEYVGGWEDYVRQRRASVPAGPGRVRELPAEAGSHGGRAGAEAGRDGGDAPKKKLSYNETRELAGLPARIEALETAQAALRQESESPEFYRQPAERIRDVLARLEALGPELEAVIARWMELEERR